MGSDRKLEVSLKDIWVPLSAAVAQQNKVDTIANNVANANTPGFKKDRLVFKEYLTALEKGLEDIDLPRKEWAPRDFYRSQGGENALVKTAASFTIFEQGALTPTGNPLDIAINGEGFIKILTPNGPRYTRRGNLSLSKDSLLVTDRGHPVLGYLPDGGMSKNNYKKLLPGFRGRGRSACVRGGLRSTPREILPLEESSSLAFPWSNLRTLPLLEKRATLFLLTLTMKT